MSLDNQETKPAMSPESNPTVRPSAAQTTEPVQNVGAAPTSAAERNSAAPPRRSLLARARRIDWRIALVLAACLLLILVWHAVRGHSTAASAMESEIPYVAVAKVSRGDLYNQVPYPAEFRPYVEVELHAKVSGYVKQMNVDFGDRVKAGQVLATLEVPELQDELHNAIAVEQKAEADHTAAHLNYTRLAAVAKEHPNLVAEQDLDTAEAKDGMTQAAIAAAKADVGKYQTLVGYTIITAPFDGVITKRYVDPGALVQEARGSDTTTLPLLRISDSYHLRLDFPVEVMYVKDVHVGDPVQVEVASLGGKIYAGKITRATDQVSLATRTMITEIEVPNPNLEIVPGMYATASLRVRGAVNALSVPIEAVSSERGSDKGSVLLVSSDGELEVRPVRLGLETPNRYEITSGLSEGDLVVVAGRSELRVGEKVKPKQVDTLSYDSP